MASHMHSQESTENRPEIETERLMLQPLSLKWKDNIFREFTEDITTFMNPRPPREISETEEFITSTIEKMTLGKEIVYVVIEKQSADFLGCAGLHHIDTPTPELGIWIKRSAHGNKYGREALTALKQWADEHLQYDHIVYPVDRDNIASRKIPESLGGTVHHEYEKQNASGKILHTVEYWIPPLK